ncbi:MAG: response regulator transcription factor [Burkholderiaceae bacterium]
MVLNLLPEHTRVMVVEDDVVLRRLICNAIELESSMILAAAFGSVTEAIKWLERETIDLLLTDLGLPDGSGLKIIHACRRFAPRADIMVITMSSDEENVLACIEAGASGYVLKEAGHTDIVQAMLEVRAGGSPISPLIARKILARMRIARPVVSEGQASQPSKALTPRENAILELIGRGDSYAKVAKAFGVSVGTVQTHITQIYGKLSVHSRGEAVFEAQRRGLLKLSAPKPGRR